MITKELPALREGIRLDYRLRIYGVPIKWQSEITAWEPPHRFVDRQSRGPYKLWVHEHTFIEHNGGTLVRDNIQYSAPGGTLVQKFLVAPDLDRIFKYRHKALKESFNFKKLTPALKENRS
jgi:ligand-binding SRPBCC domain-containing protein